MQRRIGERKLRRGEGGEFTILRTRVLASKSKEKDQSDPHGAELSTQQNQNMLEKYVEHMTVE
jgi:hypothetical protein